MLHGLDTANMMKLKNQNRRNSQQNADASPSDQSILVSGESGAIKTVTTKIVLDYFAMLSKKRADSESTSPSSRRTSGRSSQDVSIEQQVLQSNPILEAFGNARTIRNDNSSRFRKYIDISFTKKGKLVGASIETYLLEKVRLIHPGPGERNYHVFYQLVKAANASDRQDFFLGNKTCQDFRLLRDSGTFDRRDGVDDSRASHRILSFFFPSLTTLFRLLMLPSISLYETNHQDNSKAKTFTTTTDNTITITITKNTADLLRHCQAFSPREAARRKRAIARGQGFDELSEDDFDADSDDEEDAIRIKGAVNPDTIMAEAKRKRKSKAERLQKVLAGREKFEANDRAGGSTNTEKERKKNFLMSKSSKRARSKGRGKGGLAQKRGRGGMGKTQMYQEAKKRRRKL